MWFDYLATKATQIIHLFPKSLATSMDLMLDRKMGRLAKNFQTLPVGGKVLAVASQTKPTRCKLPNTVPINNRLTPPTPDLHRACQSGMRAKEHSLLAPVQCRCTA